MALLRYDSRVFGRRLSLTGGSMTRTEVELIAEVLRQKVVKIREMFRPPDARVSDVEQFAKIQILTLAHDIGIAFRKEDPTFDDILVETVRAEVNRGK